MSTYCGTIDFISPEILEGKYYDKSADMWSLGVIAYFMLSGKPPFMGKTEAQISKNIITCNYSFKDPVWKDISQGAQDFVDGMLELEPKDRMDADRALNHHWLKSDKENRSLNP